ncbi:MAG: hypothetical protein K9N48_06245 [Verrucomicrobia bacterium]|nr:hypothetical protein [Verrucomicrobiota bacterium]MCF7709280.1 hypothetical protein [Verrucomicrobiota bacterium]
MYRRLLNLGLCLFLTAQAWQVSAFSMLGPFADWMDEVKQYQVGGTLGGPMNLGEEYRWNLPIITYAYDESFLNYFGSNGVAEIEEAVQVFKDLPQMSEIDINKYPMRSKRMNYRAGALLLLDLKSYAMGLIIEELGLAPAERWVWCLREEWHEDNIPYFITIKRNFDPETWQPSSYVNGVLYTYRIYHSDTPHQADAIEIPVDPLKPAYTSVSRSALDHGEYFIGLTRDDIGALRYLYRPNNFNMENAPPQITSGNANVGSGAWFPIGGITNAVGTNVVSTNATNYIDVALRPGMNTLKFQRLEYDSMVGEFIPYTNTFTEAYISNNVVYYQELERVINEPDILFSAADLGISGIFPFLAERTSTEDWSNNDGINGNEALDGPGTIQPPVSITFNKVGPWYYNGPGFRTEETAIVGMPWFVWGSFDGSTNPPVVYPSGTSIKDLERQIRGY